MFNKVPKNKYSLHRKNFSEISKSKFSSKNILKPRIDSQKTPLKILNKILNPVRSEQQFAEDLTLCKRLKKSLESASSISQRIQTITAIWEEATVSLKNTKTLNEIKDQLVSMTQSPSNLSAQELLALNKRLESFHEELEKEKKYSKSLELKVRALSEENIRLIKKSEKCEQEMKYMIGLSQQVSTHKKHPIRIEDVIKENKRKSQTIEELQFKIERSKDYELKLLGIIEQQKKYINPHNLHRQKDMIFHEIQMEDPSTFARSFEDSRIKIDYSSSDSLRDYYISHNPSMHKVPAIPVCNIDQEMLIDETHSQNSQL